jgi:hypothetical protein
MKRRDLLRRVAKAADAKDVEWVFVRGEHDVYRLGKTIQVSIPRHQEINEITARKIMATGENELGKGWWR